MSTLTQALTGEDVQPIDLTLKRFKLLNGANYTKGGAGSGDSSASGSGAAPKSGAKGEANGEASGDAHGRVLESLAYMQSFIDPDFNWCVIDTWHSADERGDDDGPYWPDPHRVIIE